VSYGLDRLTTGAFTALVDDERVFVVLLPVGSVEPHGPHLGLVTDTAISRGAAERAAEILEQAGSIARIGPAVPYGVTDCAAGFGGAVSVSAEALTAYLRAVVVGYHATGVDHVCLINNHLEPGHDTAVRAAIDGVDAAKASVACPLTRRWARTLSAEFKSGACHAGRYETSIVMAAAPELVDDSVRNVLPEVPISLSDKLRAGIDTFAAMGMDRAYAGAPAEASAGEGEQQLDLLATMVATEVLEALANDLGDG
jgi:creatinine amidohydrolase